MLIERGIHKLLPIQEGAYSPIYEGKDFIGQERTGQGKTLAYIIPILDKIKNDT